MTTAEAILNILRSAGANGVSTHEFTYQHGIQQAPRRIHDLRKRGHEIATVDRRDLTAVFVLKREAADRPASPRPILCPRCGKQMGYIRETLTPAVVIGRCATHGDQTVKR